jgi:hypothetical protein
MKLTSINLKKILPMLLTLFVFLIGIFLFWLRFIKEKLPRSLPYEFSLFSYIVILVICLITIYTSIKEVVIPNKNKETFKQSFFIFIQQQLISVDNRVKNPLMVKPYFQKYFLILLNHLEAINLTKLYLFMQIFPKIILIVVFMVEVFNFHNINYFYKIVSLGLLPLIFTYISFSLKEVYNHQTMFIDTKADLCLSKPNNPFYRSLLCKNLVEYLELAPDSPYQVVPRLDYLQAQRIRLNIPENMRLNIDAFDRNIKGAINLCLSIKKILSLKETYTLKFNSINLTCKCLYVITTIYILLISFPLINDVSIIVFMDEITCYFPKEMIEPFSGLSIETFDNLIIEEIKKEQKFPDEVD